MRSLQEIKDAINSNEKLGGESELDKQMAPGDIRDIYNPSGKNHPTLKDEIAREKTDYKSFLVTVLAAVVMMGLIVFMGSFVMRHAASEAAKEQAARPATTLQTETESTTGVVR
ncbi:MAG: hypothetical protein Q4B59_02340 [Lachnospiraceae bacterium]|nr:hypothetical protein [Lachnospiraceae bacterium]